MNDPKTNQIPITDEERRNVLLGLKQRHPAVADKLESQIHRASGGIRSIYLQELKRNLEFLQVQHKQRMAAESIKQNNEYLVQSTTNSNSTKATLNHLLTQPVSQLSTNLQQNRTMNSPSTTLLPPNMSPFNPAARQRETTANYSPKLTNDLSSQVRPRTSNLNGFSSPNFTNVNNSHHDILHQIVVGNPPISSPTPPTPSLSGDQLLQQILLSNTDALASKKNVQNRTFVPPSSQQSTPTILPQPIVRTAVNPPVVSPQIQPIATLPTMPPANPQPSNSLTIQPTSMNNNFPRSSSTPNLDEEISTLINIFKENISKLREHLQRAHNEGNTTRARMIHHLYQSMMQFIANPTYEQLPNMRKIRATLQRNSNSNVQPTPVAPPPPVTFDLNQIRKNFGEFLSHDVRQRVSKSKLIEPLTDVLNGVPHKKIRLDVENSPQFFKSTMEKTNFSFISRLDDELKEIPEGIFSIERISPNRIDEEYLKKFGLTLRCQLIGEDYPLVPPLKLRISIDYPDEQPEILSLTKTTPPKLESTDDHPSLEKISEYFLSHLFKLQHRHRIVDLLDIWRNSVKSVL